MSDRRSSEKVALGRETLDRLFDAYDAQRRARGLGVADNRLTPSQRIDALHICLELRRAGRVGPNMSAERDFWLSYLRPVLAETREAAEALDAAFDATLRFDEQEAPSVAPPWTLKATPPFWRRWLARVPRLALPVLAGLCVLAVIALALFEAPRLLSPPAQEPSKVAGDQGEKQIVEGRQKVQQGSAQPDEKTITLAYQQEVSKALALATERNGDVTPKEMAAMFAAETPSVGSAPLALADIVRETGLAPNAPIPLSPENKFLPLYQIGAAMAAVSLGVSPRLFDELVAESSQKDGATLSGVTPATARPTPKPLWPVWVRWLAFAPLAPALIWIFHPAGLRRERAQAKRARRHDIARARRRDAKGLELLLHASSEWLPKPPDVGAAARGLMRLRDPAPGRRLDADRSLRATLASPGRLVTRMRPATRATDFVFLTRRRRHNDQARAHALRLADALRQEGVSLAFYDYSADPRRPMTLSGLPLDLRGLREQHGAATLVLCTDGEDLITRFFDRRINPHIAEALAAWPRRLLLTPVPKAEWGEREMAIAQGLDAVVIRATETGLCDLAAAARASSHTRARAARNAKPADASLLARIEAWRASALGGRERTQARPEILRRDVDRLLLEYEPDEAYRRAVLTALRSWLDSPAFMWFAACGHYPQLRFDLTLRLGMALNPFGRPGFGPVFTEERLGDLCALPWFAEGYMPEWLRRDVFAALSLPERQEVTKRMNELLRGQPSPDALPLPMFFEGLGATPIPADGVTLVNRRLAEEAPSVDQEAPGDAAAGAPDATARAALERWLWQGAARVAIVAVWCAGAYDLWPAPEKAPHPDGAFWPLIAYLAASVALGVALMVWDAVRIPPDAALVAEPEGARG